MLDRKTPETLAVELTIVGQGESHTVDVVFYNRTQDEIKRKTEELLADPKAKDEPEWVNREQFMFVVKTFNKKIPSHDGVKQLEDNWPGTVLGVFYKFHDARRVEVVKN